MTSRSYGGFFDSDENLLLETPMTPFGSNSSLVASGRSALACIVKRLKVKTLYVPAFLCRDTVQLLSGIKIKTYELGPDSYFNYEDDISNLKLGEGEFVLLVDFFGLDSKFVQALTRRFGPKAIVDYTHNLYEPFYKGLSNAFASIRKWYGITDGGVVNFNLSEPRHPIDIEVKLLAKNKEGDKDYEGFLFNEKILSFNLSRNDLYPEGMPSEKTLETLQLIDHSRCIARRRDNCYNYYLALGHLNTWHVDSSQPLLYYPLNLGRDVTDIRQRLIYKKIYIPTLWKDTVGELTEDEKTMRNHVLHLPCDYRLSRGDIEHVAKEVLSCIK